MWGKDHANAATLQGGDSDCANAGRISTLIYMDFIYEVAGQSGNGKRCGNFYTFTPDVAAVDRGDHMFAAWSAASAADDALDEIERVLHWQ
ncbi:MAG: hypothetical protein FJ271_22645 [Planctomycetes bacterium]|nr:hypothetical protein [Planctomycetota bacterium]